MGFTERTRSLSCSKSHLPYHRSFYCLARALDAWRVNLRTQYRRSVAMGANVLASNLPALKGNRLCFSIFYDVRHEHKKQNWQWMFSRFLRWDSVKFGRLVINIFLQLELVFQCNLSDKFFCSGKWHKFAKIANNANTKPTFLLFKIRILPPVFNVRRKFKKIRNKAAKTVNSASVLGIYSSTLKAKIFKRDDSKWTHH